MAEELEGEVTFVGVSNRDTVEDGKGYATTYNVPYAMAHAPEVWEAYGVPYQPVTIVIDADGGITDRIDGPVTYEDLAKRVDAVLRS